jgi:hypothetical protein
VDADKYFETAMKYDVKSVPLFVIHVNKSVMYQLAVSLSEELIRLMSLIYSFHDRFIITTSQGAPKYSFVKWLCILHYIYKGSKSTGVGLTDQDVRENASSV